MSECPKCGFQKVWKYGSRRKELRVLNKFLCTICGYVWEVEAPQVWSVGSELVEPLVKLMERAIGDAEKGMAARERGWAEFDAKTTEALVLTGLCERNGKTGKIRILPSAELPEDLATLGAAKTLLDVRKTENVAHELVGVWRGQGRYEAVLRGLGRMIESGIRVVSPVRLEGEMCSWDWFSLAHQAVNSLVLIAAEEMWRDESEKVEMARKLLGERVCGAEDVEKVLRWKNVVRGLGREALEVLGFLWFADMRLQQVEDPLGKRVAQRVLLADVGAETLKKIEEVLAEMEVSYVNFPWW